MRLKPFVRSVVLCASLASPLAAQTTDLPDVALLADSGLFDLSVVYPIAVQHAVATSEDRNFFNRFPALSPISQAVVQNFLLSGERRMVRATQTLELGIALANTYERDQIMTMFIQRIYLGANCYGFDDALEQRLDKTIETATLADLLTLATLMKGPARYETDPGRTVERFEFLIEQGERAQFWDQEAGDALRQAGPTPLINGATCAN